MKSMKKGRLFVILATLAMIAVLLVAGCSQKAAKQESAVGEAEPATEATEQLSGSLQIKGSDTMVNLGTAWAEAFMEKHPEVSLAVTGGGSGTGIAALINNTADIAQSSRPMKDEEVEEAKKNGVDVKEFIVAMDGIAVVVHPSNTVSELTMDQIADIYSGKIKNWKEVGGKDAGIVLLSRDTNSGTHVFFKEHVVQKEGKDKDAEYSKDAQMMPSSQAVANEVASNENAIGYYGLGYLSNKQKVIAVKKTDGDAGVKPSIETVRDASYGIARPLFFYTNGEPKGLVKEYLDFCMGKEGQSIVEELEFVPL